MRFKPFKAWAVVDAARQKRPDAFDLESIRRTARRLKRMREETAFPLHPGAKWRIVRVVVSADDRAKPK